MTNRKKVLQKDIFIFNFYNLNDIIYNGAYCLFFLAATAICTALSRVTATAADNYPAAATCLWLVRATTTARFTRLIGSMALARARAILLVIRTTSTAAASTTTYPKSTSEPSKC